MHRMVSSSSPSSPARVAWTRGARRRAAAGAGPLLPFLALLLCVSLACRDEAANADAQAASDPAISAIDAFIAANPVDKSKPQWRTRLRKPAKVSFDPGRTYYWKLETNLGPVQFRLFEDVAPMHVSSTIYLTRLGFYDTLKFHRVIQGFMAQGGDPLGNGRGNPGYRFDGEYSKEATHDGPGVLSSANTGRPGTDGSQFFITFKPTPHLNNKHTVYGKAESKESLATIRKMEELARPPQMRNSRPREPIVIERASILIE